MCPIGGFADADCLQCSKVMYFQIKLFITVAAWDCFFIQWGLVYRIQWTLTLFLLEIHSMKIIAYGNAMLDIIEDLVFLGQIVCNAVAFVKLDSIEKIAIAQKMVSVVCVPMAHWTRTTPGLVIPFMQTTVDGSATMVMKKLGTNAFFVSKGNTPLGEQNHVFHVKSVMKTPFLKDV
jgi:hypothetical protein